MNNQTPSKLKWEPNGLIVNAERTSIVVATVNKVENCKPIVDRFNSHDELIEIAKEFSKYLEITEEKNIANHYSMTMRIRIGTVIRNNE